MPVAAWYFAGPPEYVFVTFDKAIQPGTFANLNFTTRWNGFLRATLSAIAEPAYPLQLNVRLGFASPEPGPNVITYFATPPQVIGQNGLPVATFVNYPVT